MAKTKSKKPKSQKLLVHNGSVCEPSNLAMNQQIKTSPYTIGPVILRIGPKKREFYVPECLLENTEWTFSRSSCLDRGIISLPDVDEGTGHVLVHYLYTGAYEPLDDADVSPEKQSNIGFHRAFLTFAAALAYDLPGLQQLAMQKIHDFGTEMTVFDIITTVDKDFSKLPSGKHQLYEYISQKASSTFEQNLNKLAIDTFLEDVSNVDLAKLLVKCMVSLYDKKVLETSTVAAGIVATNSEQIVDHTGNTSTEKVGIGEPQIAEEIPPIESDIERIAGNTPAPESAVVEAEQSNTSSNTRDTSQLRNQTNWCNYAPWKSMDAKDAPPVVAMEEDCGICKKCVKKAKKKKKKNEKGKKQAAQEVTPPKTEKETIATTLKDTDRASSPRSASVDKEGYKVLD